MAQVAAEVPVQDAQPTPAELVQRAVAMVSTLRERASLKLAFGAATWPHQLVRVMLLEQVYRACTILTGHPYHRA